MRLFSNEIIEFDLQKFKNQKPNNKRKGKHVTPEYNSDKMEI